MISSDFSFDTVIVVGDRVLVKPRAQDQTTPSGLFLPPGVKENEKIQSGYVIKTGPGYPLPTIADADEPWKQPGEAVKYIPLQANVGDLCIYLQNSGYELEFNGEKYIVVPQNAILLLIREEF
ncbi:MAG: co-chaperone GroES [Candidatus Kapaibacterium sp.]|jgi:co-chaperonin GroES (HSP10)